MIKPSHYDDEGYVIQWQWAFVPSNSLACLYALARDVGQRDALGRSVEVIVSTYDELHTVIPVRRIVRRIRAEGASGVVLLAGVQSNQIPRAVDLARQFRAEGIQVAIGGFHVSGCIAMLPELPAELRDLQAMGVTLFAGEAEGRMDTFLADAYLGQMKPLYNHLRDLPKLQGQVTPYLPRKVAGRSVFYAPFDAGRGCPFECSFCTIINVQGRKSRWRTADDVERLVRAYVTHGTRRFFITDDNFARNKNWEAIFDRLIALREEEGVRIKFTMQVDMMCHKIPGFVEKATRAGCTRVFLGLENINPENLGAARKRQNHIGEYRVMLQAWRSRQVITYAGYILGFPSDTLESIGRDIETIQRELPIDILEFFVLTPLPGSVDHKAMLERDEWIEPDLNRYDLEHVTVRHPRMSQREWTEIYDRAWHMYYSPQHVETLLRRARAGGAGMSHIAAAILAYYGSYRFDRMHPLQAGLLRRKIRATRRPGSPRDNSLWFHVCHAWDTLSACIGRGLYWLWLDRLRKRIQRDPAAGAYTDVAIDSDALDTLAVRTPTDEIAKAA
ncbi:MAG: radical SAM protein [Planctomycetes bacterium]|nr:radical SAM protein [Planctomycetota bacterium]MBL7040530.1 radical SAM protein [Pirellulaceae bacterium]